jgi:hypothetical protein
LNTLPQFNYRNGFVSNNATKDLHLLLSLDAQRFQVAFVDSQNKMCLGIESYLLGETQNEDQLLVKLKQIVEKHDLLSAMFWKSVCLSINNQSFTLIPNAFFKKEYTPRYLLLARGTALTEAEEAHFVEHQSLGAKNVFSIERKTLAWFQEMYPFQSFELIHQTSGLIEAGLRANNATLIFYEKEAFTLIHIKAGQLMYCNRFQYKTHADFVYYVLFVLKELNIDYQEAQPMISGDIDTDNQAFIELLKFVPNLKTGTNLSKIQLPNDLPPTRFASLLNSLL